LSFAVQLSLSGERGAAALDSGKAILGAITKFFRQHPAPTMNKIILNQVYQVLFFK